MKPSIHAHLALRPSDWSFWLIDGSREEQVTLAKARELYITETVAGSDRHIWRLDQLGWNLESLKAYYSSSEKEITHASRNLCSCRPCSVHLGRDEETVGADRDGGA